MSTPISPNTIDKIFLTSEKYLNVVGYIPIVSTFSSLIRCAIGLAQIISGLAVAIFAGLAYLFNCCCGNIAARTRFSHLFARGTNYIAQGFSNELRVTFEIAPIENLLCLAYDLFHSPELNFRYPSEPLGYQRHIDCITNTGASMRYKLGLA